MSIKNNLTVKCNQKRRRDNYHSVQPPSCKRRKKSNPHKDEEEEEQAENQLNRLYYDIWKINNTLQIVSKQCATQLIFNKIYRDKYRRVKTAFFFYLYII